MLFELAQRLLPASAKIRLKPYFRRFFPGLRMGLIHPTFRCNYHCSYCHQHGALRTRYASANAVDKTPREHTVEEWVAALSGLPRMQLYFQGGEPMIFKDFPELLNRLERYHGLQGFVSNASAPVEEYLRINNRNLHLNLSYHPDCTDVDEFARKCGTLNRHFKVMVNYVATRNNLVEMVDLGRRFRELGVAFHVDREIGADGRHTALSPEEETRLADFLARDRRLPDFYTAPVRKTCSAGRNYMAILPDGNVFACCRYADLSLERAEAEAAMGNVFDRSFRFADQARVCDIPCINACDYDRVSIHQ